jgi:hypothetical protein
MHDHGSEKLPPPSGEASVMLDVGGTNGALVMFTPAQLDGAEIEIRRTGQPWDGTHTAVRRRDLPDHTAFAGVFGTLPAGEYELRVLGSGRGPAAGAATTRLVVRGGEVTQAHWPASPVGPATDLPAPASSAAAGPGS